MKFLLKMTLLILVCMSNSVLGIITAKELLKEANDMKQASLKIQNQFEQVEQAIKKIEQERSQYLAKVAEDIVEIIDSHDCNCTKLNLLDNSELK